MNPSTPLIRSRPVFALCPVCRKKPRIVNERSSAAPLRLAFFVACKCKEGDRANSGKAALDKWNEGRFVRCEKTL